MRFVADDKIPPAIWRAQLLLHVLVAGQLVQPGNDEICFQNQLPVRAASSLSLVKISNGRWKRR